MDGISGSISSHRFIEERSIPSENALQSTAMDVEELAEQQYEKK